MTTSDASRTPARTYETPPSRTPVHAAGSNGKDVERIPFRGVRRTIAERLRQSVNFAVHFNVMDEADVSAADSLRRKLSAASGEKVSLLPFVASAVCRVLSGRLGPQFTALNATVDDEKQEIVRTRAVHLGIAADTDSGLMVPVIRNVDTKTLGQLAAEAKSLYERVRAGKPRGDDLVGGTFTVSNLGPYGIDEFQAVINPPQAMIMAIGAGEKRPYVIDDSLQIATVMSATGSFDHRAIDGADGARLMKVFKELVESPLGLVA